MRRGRRCRPQGAAGVIIAESGRAGAAFTWIQVWLGVDGLRAGVVTSTVMVVRPLVQTGVQPVLVGVQLVLAGVEPRVTRVHVFTGILVVPMVPVVPGVPVVPRIPGVPGVAWIPGVA